MKNKNKKLKKALIYLIPRIIILMIIYLNVVAVLNYEERIIQSATREMFKDFEYVVPQVIIPGTTKVYKYNERVSEGVILKEINTLAERFNINADNWEKILRCESGLNNLAKNRTSTALGLSQYLIKTWEETESFKQFKKARTDYKASLWEMALDIKAGEQWRWQECLIKTGIKNI